jgi:hypothetical protein
MKILAITIAAGAALLVATQANAGTLPLSGLTGVQANLVEQVAVRVYVFEGHRYCFYFDGWHGPGWYRCGYAFRRGLGWGGVYGWNDWSYGPYERRHHRARIYHRDHDRVGVHSRSRTEGSVTIRSRSSTSGQVQHRTRVQRNTTESGARVNVPSRAGAKIQSETTGSGVNIRGGASVGGDGAGDRRR